MPTRQSKKTQGPLAMQESRAADVDPHGSGHICLEWRAI
jgi:hypothetical protein